MLPAVMHESSRPAALRYEVPSSCRVVSKFVRSYLPKRFSFVIDFTEPNPQEDSPDQRARVLGEHDHMIRAAAARMTALVTSDTQIATVLSVHGIQIQTALSY